VALPLLDVARMMGTEIEQRALASPTTPETARLSRLGFLLFFFVFFMGTL
jgi:hypothetical protein